MPSFKNRLLILIVALVALAQGVTVFSVLVYRDRGVRQEAARELARGLDVVRRQLDTRGAQLRSAVAVLVADFGFKAAVASGDAATIRSALANQANRIDASFAAFYDHDGRAIAAAAPALRRDGTPDLPDPQALARGEDWTLAVIDGHPVQLVRAELRAPEPIGWVVLGFTLDAGTVRDFARLVDLDLSFIADGAGANGGIAVSTLPAEALAALRARLAGGGLPADAALQLAGDDYLARATALPTLNGRIELIAQRSQDAAMAPFRELRLALLAIGGAALLGAIVVALLAGRGAVRPLGQLVNAAGHVEQGVYCENIVVTGGVEFQRLAGAFNAMQASIREREARIRHQALHDALTGLPNREGLRALLESAPPPEPCSVALIDIHRFRDVNASVGHQVGDELLRALAGRLQELGGGRWPCARVGADQFAIVASLHDSELLHRLLVLADALRAGLALGALRQSVDLRAGISEWRAPRVAAVDLLRQADVALLQAKERGSVGELYVGAHDAEHQRRVLLVAELRRALAGEGLALHFQPLVGLRDRAPVAFEALLRWTHPTLGSISPGEFVPLAERASVLPDLSRWVLRTAVAQLGAWQAAGIDVEIAVNLSAADFADGELAARVLALLREFQVPAGRLLLEVTESTIMREPRLAAQVMQQLRTAGVRFAIDDFGTGHSSLAQLHALPVDELKIDRAFVLGLDSSAHNQAIVRTTVELGHSLGLQVVAEGIETPEVWSALLRLGCDLAQGYFISRPMPAAAVPDWLRRQREQLELARQAAGSAGTLATLRPRQG
ncbi:MAG: EAL domain-containing protein [Steroidobacteraceae bacterium]